MRERSILVSDFDGTITRYDFYDLICRRYPEILAAGHWERYEVGEITHFEALRRIFAEIRTDEKVLNDIMREMEVCPRLAESVGALRARGWVVWVASAGCDWYIQRILHGAGVDVPVHANPGRFDPERGLLMELPVASVFCSHDLGINKVAVVRDALARVPRVAFAGDGRPDLPAALLVDPRRRFARNWLAVKLREIGEDFQPFERWSEVADALIAEDERC